MSNWKHHFKKFKNLEKNLFLMKKEKKKKKMKKKQLKNKKISICLKVMTKLKLMKISSNAKMKKLKKEISKMRVKLKKRAIKKKQLKKNQRKRNLRAQKQMTAYIVFPSFA